MTDKPASLTPSEAVFVARMAHHVARGLSFDDAARAVIADDQRIFAALCDRRSMSYVPTPDERGRAWDTGERPGNVIEREMAHAVWSRIRAGAAP
jgi:hypothetical protein